MAVYDRLSAKGADLSEVMITLRFEGDADELCSKWQRVVALWEKDFEAAGPATLVARGEDGGLFVVNIFPNDEAHKYFGRNMGGPMEAVGLFNPQLEHLEVLATGFERT
jgi:hypothetical protein